MLILCTDRHTFWVHIGEKSREICIYKTRLISHKIITKWSDFETTCGIMTPIKGLPSTAPAVIRLLPHSLSTYNTLYVPEHRKFPLSRPWTLQISCGVLSDAGFLFQYVAVLRKKWMETLPNNMASCVKKRRNLFNDIPQRIFSLALFYTVLSSKITLLFLLRFLWCC